MHQGKNRNTYYFKIFRAERGAVLVLSLLLLSVLTMLSLSLIDSSLYTFKSQISRLEHQRALHNSDSVRRMAKTHIEAYLKNRDWSLVENSNGLILDPEGAVYFENVLSLGGHSGDLGNYQAHKPKKLFSYQSEQISGEVYLSSSIIVSLQQGSSVSQFRSYEGFSSGLGAEGSLILYLEIHSVGSAFASKKGTISGRKEAVHTISDYRLVI